MTDLNSQLTYTNNLHYQQQQQFQSHLQELQNGLKNGKDKLQQTNSNENSNDPNNILTNLPMEQSHHSPIQQVVTAQTSQAQATQGQTNPQLLNNNFNNNGLFSDTLSPFFAPYGIDVSHFPLTNPPIFESALMANNQGYPRRRISISNGQIGQITTHGLNNDDLYDSQPPPLPKQTSQDDCDLQYNNGIYNQLNIDLQQQQQPQSQTTQNMTNLQHHQIPSQPIQRQVPQQQQVPNPPPIKQENPFPTQGPTGIPNHKLVYNNEIIFNPDAGPIPGTAAWKKARLLERNRIAASKCRQRKKAAHIQLKEDVEKYQYEINRLKRDKRELLAFYNQVKQFYEQGVVINDLALLIKGVNVKNSVDDEEINYAAEMIDEDEDDDE